MTNEPNIIDHNIMPESDPFYKGPKQATLATFKRAQLAAARKKPTYIEPLIQGFWKATYHSYHLIFLLLIWVGTNVDSYLHKITYGK